MSDQISISIKVILDSVLNCIDVVGDGLMLVLDLVAIVPVSHQVNDIDHVCVAIESILSILST